MTRRFAFIAAICAMLFSPVAVAADEPLSDYDRRAAAAMFSLLSGQDVDAKTIDMSRFNTLNLKKRDPAGGKSSYAVHFGAASGPDGDSRGYYKVSRGEEASDPTTKGWTAWPTKSNDPLAPELYYKRVEGGGFLEVAARKSISGVILTVNQRRPLNEDLNKAGAEMTNRYNKLMAAAQKYGLLPGRIKLTRLAADGSAVAEVDGQSMKFGLSDSKPTTITIRVEVKSEGDTNAKDVKRLSFVLSGPLAEQAKLEVPGGTQEGLRTILLNPPEKGTEIKLTLPQNTPALEQAIFSQATAAANDASPTGVQLKVGASFGTKVPS